MPKNVMCKKCNNLINGWCEKKIDSPDPNMVRDCQYFWEKTNADRIRAMSDEALADFFFESPEIEFTVCEYCQYFGGHTSDTPCKHDMGRCFVSAKSEAFKKWLKQPAEGD